MMVLRWPDPEKYADLYRRVTFAFGDGDEAIRLQDPDKLDRLVVVLGCDGRAPYVASALIDGQAGDSGVNSSQNEGTT